jgi:hypothetical protein
MGTTACLQAKLGAPVEVLACAIRAVVALAGTLIVIIPCGRQRSQRQQGLSIGRRALTGVLQTKTGAELRTYVHPAVVGRGARAVKALAGLELEGWPVVAPVSPFTLQAATVPLSRLCTYIGGTHIFISANCRSSGMVVANSSKKTSTSWVSLRHVAVPAPLWSHASRSLHAQGKSSQRCQAIHTHSIDIAIIHAS